MKGITRVRHGGMTLIEVMVALLVLGVGVMGYAALQLHSVKMTDDTYARSQAMAIAQDAVERVRANINALSTYTAASNWGVGGGAPATTCTFTNATPSKCEPAQLAAVDIYQLETAAKTMLPTGTLKIVPCQQLTCVIVAWNETVAALSTGANTAECSQQDIDDGARGNAASCVIVEFTSGG